MKTRKKNICISMILAMLLLLSACANGNETPSEPAQSDSEQPAVTPSEPSAISPAKGTVKTVKTFEYNDFALEVSNVKEIKQGSSYDGMETWKYDIYVVYPGAIAKVLNADTFIDEETNLPHADWAFLTLDDERIDIMDDMEPLEITGDMLGVYNTESSIYVLGFEMYDGNSQEN